MDDDIAGLYQELCAPMPTHKVQKGGPALDYITTEACTTRLNTTLGPDRWSLVITERWYDQEADECCLRGYLEILWPSGRVTRHEDIGNQIPNRRRGKDGEQGDVIEIGNDWKGARSDLLKRCAADIGVGLWLYSKERARDMAGAQVKPSNGAEMTGDGAAPICEGCGNHLHPAKFADGTIWTVDDLAGMGRRKHGRVLCMNHFRQANAERIRNRDGDDGEAPGQGGALGRTVGDAVPPVDRMQEPRERLRDGASRPQVAGWTPGTGLRPQGSLGTPERPGAQGQGTGPSVPESGVLRDPTPGSGHPQRQREAGSQNRGPLGGGDTLPTGSRENGGEQLPEAGWQGPDVLSLPPDAKPKVNRRAAADFGSPTEIPPNPATTPAQPDTDWDDLVLEAESDPVATARAILGPLRIRHGNEPGGLGPIPAPMAAEMRKALESLGLTRTEDRVRAVHAAFELTPSDLDIGHARAIIEWAATPEAKAQAAALVRAAQTA